MQRTRFVCTHRFTQYLATAGARKVDHGGGVRTKTPEAVECLLPGATLWGRLPSLASPAGTASVTHAVTCLVQEECEGSLGAVILLLVRWHMVRFPAQVHGNDGTHLEPQTGALEDA